MKTLPAAREFCRATFSAFIQKINDDGEIQDPKISSIPLALIELSLHLKEIDNAPIKSTRSAAYAAKQCTTGMDSLITLLRDKRNVRNAEHQRIVTEQELQHKALLTDLKELKDKRLQCTETIVKNLNTTTGHRHTISKVVHQSEQCTGLPISNMHHRQAVDFFSDAINLVNNQVNLSRDKNLKDSIDACKLSTDVQHCTLSAAESFKGIKSSIDKAETLIHSIHIIADEYGDEYPSLLETSMF